MLKPQRLLARRPREQPRKQSLRALKPRDRAHIGSRRAGVLATRGLPITIHQRQRRLAHRAVSLPGADEQVQQIRSHAITSVSRSEKDITPLTFAAAHRESSRNHGHNPRQKAPPDAPFARQIRTIYPLQTTCTQIRHGHAGAPRGDEDGTVGRSGATCVACGSAVAFEYVRAEGRARRIGARLIAVVADGVGHRTYLSPDEEHEGAAAVERPDSAPEASIPPQAPSFRVQTYGMNHWADLFTHRQLLALTTLSDLVMEARDRVLHNAIAAGAPTGDRLERGGTEAAAYADAVATYLGLGVSRTTDLGNSLATWSSSRDQTRNLFARQAVPMAWDFVEVSPFAGASGDV